MYSIEDLYLGNSVPVEAIRDSKITKKALRTLCECEEKLICSLSSEQKELLNKIIDNHSIIMAETNRCHFEHGFRLGVQIMSECFSNND